MNRKSCLVPTLSNYNYLKYYLITINVNNILDILGISVFGYSIYMYEKKDLFSNDIDNAGFKHESDRCIHSIFIV